MRSQTKIINIFFTFTTLYRKIYILLGNIFGKAKFITLHFTAWKGSVFGVVLVRIFQHSDWIRGNNPYFSLGSPNAGKYGPE